MDVGEKENEILSIHHPDKSRDAKTECEGRLLPLSQDVRRILNRQSQRTTVLLRKTTAETLPDSKDDVE